MTQWVAAIKGYTNRYFSKLCRYTLNGDQFTVAYYYFDTPNIVDSGIKVGTCVPPIPYNAGTEDANCQIQCQGGIVGPPHALMNGSFTVAGNRYTFTYVGGQVEIWESNGVNMWTLVWVSYCWTDCWGWAFESLPIGTMDRTKNFAGEYQRFNGWSNINEPKRSDQFGFNKMFLTDTGVLRNLVWDIAARQWVNRYFAMIGDLIIYQVSHDFDNDGKIEKGHTYVGYPIYQATGHRGFVFADVSEAPHGGTFAAMYYWE